MKIDINYKDCIFCNELFKPNSQSTEDFKRVYKDIGIDQVLHEWSDFSLLLDIAPVEEGHLLLVPKSHFISSATIQGKLKENFLDTLKHVIGKLKIIYPNKEILLFEHGNGFSDGEVVRCGSCASTSHAHIHLVPLEVSATPAAKQLSDRLAKLLDLNIINTNPYPNLIDFTGDNGYLYLWSTESESSYIHIKESKTQDISSQILRKLVAERKTKLDTYDWIWQEFIMINEKLGSTRIINTSRKWKENYFD